MLGLMINSKTMFVIPADVLSCNMSARLIPPTPHFTGLVGIVMPLKCPEHKF